MFQKLILLGRIGKMEELKTSQTGKEYLTFSVACSEYVNKEQKTTWFTCKAFGNTAKFISQFFEKGSTILIEGKIQTGQYTDKNGVERYTWDVFVNQANFSGDKKGDKPKNNDYDDSTYGSPFPSEPSYDDGLPF